MTPEATMNWDDAADFPDDGAPVPHTQPNVETLSQLAEDVLKEEDYPDPPDMEATLATIMQPGEEKSRLVDIEPSPEEIAAAEALLARVGRGPKSLDAPVSQSNDPINLIIPDDNRMSVIDAGDVQIIASSDRIEVVRKVLGGDAPVSRQTSEPPPVAERITLVTSAEQEVGRRNLKKHKARAEIYPRNKPTPQELARDAPPIQIIRDDRHPYQHLLNRPVQAGKGPGY